MLPGLLEWQKLRIKYIGKSMTKDETIEKLWEQSNHGTRREDVEAAYNAGAIAEREECIKACEAAQDTGNATGIERDVTIWNKAVAYCVSKLKERHNA